jgi:fructokinase
MQLSGCGITARVIWGGVEGGGTKWICAVGTGPDDLRAIETIPTTDPEETLGRVAAFFSGYSDLAAVGVGSFGPLDLDEASVSYGSITTTPKRGWRGTNVKEVLASKLALPVAIDTDVDAAAIGEGRFGAARGVGTFCYITIGTGIGGGAIVDGSVVHGLLHPEFGHMRVPHDRERDPFPGLCPFHADCFEGLASGGALRERYGVPAHELNDNAAWELEAEYIALGLINIVSVLSPQRIVLGGGVSKGPGLFPLVRGRLSALAGGYFDSPALAEEIGGYVAPPALGDRAGVIGALELARTA